MKSDLVKPEADEAGKRALRTALGRFATGVTIVTALSPDGRKVGLTVNSFASLSLDPPLILWSIDNRQPSVDAFSLGAAFAVHVMAADQEEMVMRFARAATDKFEGVATHEGLGGVPLLDGDGACALFECAVEALYPGGDHTIIVGRVRQFAASTRAPILFAGGKFGQFNHG